MKKFFGILLLCLGVLALPFEASAQNVFISLSDSVAGEANGIRVSGLLEQEEIGLTLIRPDQTQLLFSEQADDFGVMSTEVFGLHLQQAGEYQLRVQRYMNPRDFVVRNFEVSPGKVSAYRSKIEVRNPSVAADGETQSFFIGSLRDAYGNVIKNQSVKVYSSRNEDIVVVESLSDQYGEISGKIKSQTPGVSVLSMLAGEVLIFQKPEVIFHLDSSPLENVGAPDFGRFLKASLFDESGFEEMAYFTIEDLPSEVSLGKNYTFRVIAKDEDGNVVKNYLGKVRFSTSDETASRPSDYQFDEEDQGVHIFSLAITFEKEGQHTFTVHDLSDFRITGERSVSIIDESKLNNPDDDTPDGIEILTPRPGTLRSSRITITGTTHGVDFVKIEDGPTMLVEELSVEADGSFVYQTPGLADGIHKFLVSSQDGSIISKVVTVKIDQSPPSIMAVEIVPSGTLLPGQDFQIKVSSSELLSSAKCVFTEVLTALDSAGDKFVGTLKAPSGCGSYPVSCTISDLLGNELEEPNAAVIQVCANAENNAGQDSDGDGISDLDEIADQDGDGVPDFLESSTFDSDGNGVPDQEDPNNDSDGDGVSNQMRLQQGKLPFDVKAYRFITNVSDADEDGILDKDEIADQDGDGVADLFEANNKNEHTDPSNDTDGGGVANNIELQNGTNPLDPMDDEALLIKNFTAESGKNKIVLFWSPVKGSGDLGTGGIGVATYRIEFGKMKGSLNDESLIPDARTQWYIDGLDGGTEYFFQAFALNAAGGTVATSNVIGKSTFGEALLDLSGVGSGENSVALQWTAMTDGKAVEKYRIEFGKTKQDLNEEVNAPSGRTGWTLGELEKGRTYFFRVLGVSIEGTILYSSKIIEVATLGGNLHEVAPQQNPTSGANSWIPFIIAFFVGILFFGASRKG